ncbi:MAG: DUF3025 domain-containing protein [Comamonadaceae bacterium]|nr:DUF3025 domain-containing protein [Comamonadaceae bacterium]
MSTETPAQCHTLLQRPGCAPLQRLDWAQPWLAPFAQPYGAPLAQAVLVQGQPVHQALNQVAHPEPVTTASGPSMGRAPGRKGVPRFVAQQQLPAGVSYEAFIHDQWAVPTRDHVHDFFNGLIWLHFPRSKARLNAIQAEQIRQLGIQGRRGPVRDACTLFDENGALLLAPQPLWQALLARDWLALFWTLRPLWRQAFLVLFGHALLEQLCAPRKPLCAHVLTLPLASNPALAVAWQAALGPAMAPTAAPEPAACALPQCPAPLLAAWDQALSQALQPDRLAHKPLTPLPVLGLPGWWPANAQRAFYEDQQVFRPPRR